jgi:hypothetical protein
VKAREREERGRGKERDRDILIKGEIDWVREIYIKNC